MGGGDGNPSIGLWHDSEIGESYFLRISSFDIVEVKPHFRVRVIRDIVDVKPH